MYNWNISKKYLNVFFIQNIILVLIVSLIIFICYMKAKDMKEVIQFDKIRFEIVDVEKAYANEIKNWGLFPKGCGEYCESFENSFFAFYYADKSNAIDTKEKLTAYFQLNREIHSLILNIFLLATILIVMNIGLLIYSMYARRKCLFAIFNIISTFFIYLFIQMPSKVNIIIIMISFILSIFFAINDLILINKKNVIIKNRKNIYQ